MPTPCPLFFRLRIVLQAHAAVHLRVQHGPALYALLAAAWARGNQEEPAVPDGLLLNAPEQGRLLVRKGEPYAFGLTLLASSGEEATLRCCLLLKGLEQLGRKAEPGQPAWGGNFVISDVEDLVARQKWGPTLALQPVPASALQDAIACVARQRQITLRFVSPLRCSRGKNHVHDGHAYFDSDWFDARIFTQRLWRRLHNLGCLPDEACPLPADTELHVARNRLIWLDVVYGAQRKFLSGVMGRVVVDGITPELAPAFVLGQYAHIGEATRFGYGAFRIEELGPDPFACRRARSLLEIAMADPVLDKVAAEADLPSGELSELARDVLAGRYTPAAPARVRIPRDHGAPRELAIPGPRDRALQRVVLETVAPALDQFFEESSLAYRKGLGRHKAASAVQRAYAHGYRWAVRADFAHFFDSVDHLHLQERLEAYLVDESLTTLLMTWVKTAAPTPTKGLPTGSPLSPVLANLFLEQFDEEIGHSGARLIRYADDFLILTRTPQEAEAIFHTATQAAKALQLELNRDKTAFIDLDKPFRFLGFEFHRRGRWEMRPGQPPAALSELGWVEAPRMEYTPSFLLPGEEKEADLLADATYILGPEIAEIQIEGNRLLCRSVGGGKPVEVPLEPVREFLVLGYPSLGPKVIETLTRRGLALCFANESGQWSACLDALQRHAPAATLSAQCRVLEDARRRLVVATSLIAAKLRNYAVLAEAFPDTRSAAKVGADLRTLADSCAKASSLEQLLGWEGAGASRWYGTLHERLPYGFHFSHRVAPNADDPVNVLLNIAQTALHHYAIHACAIAGLSPMLGIFHECRSGHPALASDLQEPFRPIMDRIVLESLRRMRPDDFELDRDGPYTLRMHPGAARRFTAAVARQLAWRCRARDQSESRPYRLHLVSLARRLHHCLLHEDESLEVFQFP